MTRLSYRGRLDPQMAEVLERQTELAPDLGEMHKLSLTEVRQHYENERAFWNADAPALASVSDEVISATGSGIPVRIYRPTHDTGRPTIVFLHGGGWIVGSRNSHDKVARMLSLKSGWPTISVDYALAPEHKFPIAIEQCRHVVEYLADDGERLGLRGDAIALAGDSAGANMCAALALQLREDRVGLIRKLLLFYGGFGLKDSGSRRLYGSAEDGMGPADLAYYRDCYLRDVADQNDPRYNILDQDLRGLPPAFIVAAEFDPVLDDSTTLAAQLSEAGVENELAVYPGVLHGFLHYSRMLDKAADALQRAAESLGNSAT